jgi:DNA-binding response OmpR family regulator
MPESILIIEDEPALQDTLAYNLKKEGIPSNSWGMEVPHSNTLSEIRFLHFSKMFTSC